METRQSNSIEPIPATVDDLPKVLSLLKDSGLPCDGVVDYFPGAYLVARSDDSLLAVAGLEPYRAAGLLRSVAVSPKARGAGLGKALVEALLRKAHDHGLRQSFLLTTTAADYFRRLGFIDTNR